MKHTGDWRSIKLDLYRYLKHYGKFMYFITKLTLELTNAAREAAIHLSRTGEEQWIEMARFFNFEDRRKLNHICREPRKIRSISLFDSNHTKDPNDTKGIAGIIITSK
jgi:N-glycosylase/DNA lyase